MKLQEKHISRIAIVLLILFLWFKGCGNPEPNDEFKITIPEVKGKFETVYNPTPIPRFNPVIKYSFPTKTDTVFLESDSPIDQELMQRFINSNIEKNNELNSLFKEAIKENEYSIVKEDENIKTTNYFKTQGKLLEFRQDYTIKEKQITIKTKNHFFIGADANSNIKLDQLNFDAKLFLQNKKGDLFYGGYGTEKNITIGYAKKLW